MQSKVIKGWLLKALLIICIHVDKLIAMTETPNFFSVFIFRFDNVAKSIDLILIQLPKSIECVNCNTNWNSYLWQLLDFQH